MIQTRRLIVPGLLFAALVVVGALILRSERQTTEQVITAKFENVNGLIAGAPVRAGGVRVGSVEEVDLDDSDVPLVTMKIDSSSNYVVREGATANLSMLSQAGQLNRYIELTAGAGAPLTRNATLPLSRTDQPVQLDDVFSTLNPATRADAHRIVATLDRATQGRGGDISATLANSAEALRQAAALAADLAADGPALRRVVRETQVVVTRLASDPQDLGGTADELAGTLAVTARRQRELAATVDGLAPGLRGARRSLSALNATIPDLRRAGIVAQPAASELRKTTPDLVRVLETAPAGLTSLAAFARTASPRLRAAKPMLVDLRPLLERLPVALKEFNPIVDWFRVYIPDVFGFLPSFGSAFSRYDANGHMVNATVILAGPPKGETDADGVGPGAVPFPFMRVPGAIAGQPWSNFKDSFIGERPWDPTPKGAQQAKAARKGTR